MQAELETFRSSVRHFIAENFPPSLAGKTAGMEEAGLDEDLGHDLDLWIERLAHQGWGAPAWPGSDAGNEYGFPGIRKAPGAVVDLIVVDFDW
ncbi:hypothetical protein [Haliea sp. E17]|uniref:hypothetical protein n=1 Tax=Haliea sp. E17 TaxID=3401576 RepID=UPI003AAA33E3